jgi:hypothetical protein
MRITRRRHLSATVPPPVALKEAACGIKETNGPSGEHE